MYQTGDQVVYGIHGVCRVVDIEKQIVNKKTEVYLVLEPVLQDGSRYLVPTSCEAAMSKLKPVLTKAELESLLRSDFVRSIHWISDENQRKYTYRELISSGNREELMRMVHTLYVHKTDRDTAGKKVHLADDNFLRDAEKLLAGETAVVMNISLDEARAYLREQLKKP